MAPVPDDLLFSSDHHWVRHEGDHLRIGLTDYAQQAIGEVTMVAVTSDGSSFDAGAEIGEVEAFKAITDLYMPVRGTVVSANDSLVSAPEQVNDDPYGTGWVAIIAPDSVEDLTDLLDSAAYRALIGDDDV